MNDPAQALRDFKPAHEFFVGIDSDGCVFDSMEIKHKECFTPMFIKYFGLQAVSKYARETWDFVNLYSKTRGANRFPALARALKLLANRPEVITRRVNVPLIPALDQWIARESRLGNATLNAEVQKGNLPLEPVKRWSDAVNAQIADLVHDVPPFPYVRECLEKLQAQADLMVISQTPGEALEREWAEHGISQYVRLIAGQEMGTKTEHLRFASQGKYAPGKVLMVGDAPGDYQAARANQALFYPIIPGREEGCWNRLFEEGIARFFSCSFAGAYEEGLRKEFEASLPDDPPWA